MKRNLDLIKKCVACIEHVVGLLDNHPSEVLVKEAIDGYGFQGIKDFAKSDNISGSVIHSCLSLLVNIFDVLDEELCMELDFYELKDELESSLIKSSC